MITSNISSDPPPKSEEDPAPGVIWRSFSYLKPYKRYMIGAYLFLFIINILNLLIPQFIRLIIDRGIVEQDLRWLGWSVVALLGLTMVKGGLTFLQGRWTEVASQSVAYDLRNAIQNKLTFLSFSYHDKTEAGQLLSRAVQDVERIRFLTGRATLGIANGVVLLVGTAIVLFWMNAQLALLVILTTPFLVHRALAFASQYRPLAVEIQNQLAVITSQLEQNLRGARVVKAFAQEDPETARFDEKNETWFSMAAKAAKLQGINVPMLDLIANIGTIFIIWYGGLLVIRDQLTIGELVAFTTYLALLTNPIRRLGMIIPAMAIAEAAGKRIFEILDAVPDVKDAPKAKTLPNIQGHVQFKNVSFGYINNHMVLKNLSFEVKPGQIIALLGETGSGKSTITSLLPRFYDPSSGCITIDGYNIRDVSLQSLRDQIGIVLQETTLFASTIRENIAFGRPDASMDEVIAAAKAAQAHEFITQMPNGYQTDVGERGVTLSGGQKQRMAIARALLTDPRILILDDATASVDTETEQLIQRALATLMQGRTSFVIAHRLSTMRKADLILVLKKGAIIARGTHETLLQENELYKDIYNRQLRPQHNGTVPPGELDMTKPLTSEQGGQS